MDCADSNMLGGKIYNAADTVVCGLDFVRGTILFTRNGVLLGEFCLSITKLINASVGLRVDRLRTPQKESGKDGVYETTPNVKSYSGYIDLDADSHTFFWFFEARTNPDKAPITL
jgi:hypothetical protein